jgi:hypothetical protein
MRLGSPKTCIQKHKKPIDKTSYTRDLKTYDSVS